MSKEDKKRPMSKYILVFLLLFLIGGFLLLNKNPEIRSSLTGVISKNNEQVNGVSPEVAGEQAGATAISVNSYQAGQGLNLNNNTFSRVSGTVNGQIEFWDGNKWLPLAPGETGQFLVIQGGTPSWQNLSVPRQPAQTLGWNEEQRSLSISSGNSVVIQDKNSTYGAGYGLALLNGNFFVNAPNCSLTGDKLLWNGSSFICGTDGGGVTYAAGNGISMVGNVFSIDSLTCLGANKLQWDGSSFVCSADVNTDSQAISLNANVLSISGNASTVNLSSYLDNTDAQSLSFGANLLSISGSAGTIDLSSYLDNTDLLAATSCAANETVKYISSVWTCAPDNVNDADANATNELQELALNANNLGLSSSGVTVNLSPYLDNTDSQAISLNANVLSISGNASTVNLSSYLDNTDAQSLSFGANLLSISGSAGTIDLSSYLDNTDLLAATSCAANETVKYISSVWTCAPDNDTTYSAGTGISFAGTVISSTLGIA